MDGIKLSGPFCALKGLCDCGVGVFLNVHPSLEVMQMTMMEKSHLCPQSARLADV